jgi:hypothetical protein
MPDRGRIPHEQVPNTRRIQTWRVGAQHHQPRPASLHRERFTLRRAMIQSRYLTTHGDPLNPRTARERQSPAVARPLDRVQRFAPSHVDALDVRQLVQGQPLETRPITDHKLAPGIRSDIQDHFTVTRAGQDHQFVLITCRRGFSKPRTAIGAPMLAGPDSEFAPRPTGIERIDETEDLQPRRTTTGIQMHHRPHTGGRQMNAAESRAIANGQMNPGRTRRQINFLQPMRPHEIQATQLRLLDPQTRATRPRKAGAALRIKRQRGPVRGVGE